MIIVDGHAHVLNADYGNIDLLIKQHDEAGIQKGVLVPGGMVDVRRMSKYVVGNSEPPLTLIPDNQLVEKILNSYQDRFYGFYCVNPSKGESVAEEFRNSIKRGFSGLKLSPVTHQFSLTGSVAKELALVCGELQVPFYTHVVYSPGAGINKIGVLAQEFPSTNFIVGHLGFGPLDVDAIELAYKYDNVFLETSTANPLGVSEAYRKTGASKIIYGSEFPLSHPFIELAKIKILKSSDSDEELMLGKNILRLINKLK